LGYFVGFRTQPVGWHLPRTLGAAASYTTVWKALWMGLVLSLITIPVILIGAHFPQTKPWITWAESGLYVVGRLLTLGCLYNLLWGFRMRRGTTDYLIRLGTLAIMAWFWWGP
jgi:hypothetical protein